MKFCGVLIILFSLIYTVRSWDTEELEIFDLVEEINQNFYELMGLTQEATGQEVKRAFRNLSIILHPDKSDAEDANIQFRNLVSVYEVLKDRSKREKYDKVLKEGLPNWKSALYYYRRVRKMGLAEGALIIFVIITIGQYFFAWAAYLEKKYTAEQVFGTKIKKLQKKHRANVDIDAILNEIPAPSIFNTLPFQIPCAIWNLPKTIKSAFESISEYKRQEAERKKLEAEELDRQRLLEEELVKEKEARKEMKENIRKRRQAKKAPEKTDEDLVGYSQLKVKEFNEDDAVRPVTHSKLPLSGGFWTDDDLVELIRLVKKYPGGTSNRWEVIGDTMNRSVPEVTFMAAKLKENGYRIPGQTDSIAETIVQEAAAVKKLKTKKSADPIMVHETNWTQDQQRALEAAIMKYRKTGNADRWQKIANNVPGKTKEECLLRYKYLVDLIKSQKDNKANENELNTEKGSETQTETTESNENSTTADVESMENVEINQNEEEENDHTEEIVVETKGKRRNKRKERKKRQEFSSDEDYSDY